MIGPIQQSEAKLFHYGVNLEKRVRPNNPLRAIKRAVDFRFVRGRVEGFYGSDGHESEDPIVIMKLMLLLFLDDHPSERELMRVVEERLDYLWFLGLGLEDEVPDHSVLSKARRRWGRQIFEKLFIRTVQMCLENGQVDGKKIHMDGTLINGNASKDSVKRGPVVLMEQLKEVYRKQEQKLEDVANAEAASKGAETFSFEALGMPYTQGTFKYQVRCLESLRAAYRALAPNVRAQLDGLLEKTGCKKPLAG